jgi:peptide/nickel transport system ATP-binding protein
MTPLPVLHIDGLTVAYASGGRSVNALREISLSIPSGQTYGLVGESGSGKTTLALAVMRYLAKEGRVTSGRILLDDIDLLALSPAQMRAVWGAKITLVPQDPFSSLNPSIKAGEQIAEALRAQGKAKGRVHEHVLGLLRQVRLPDAERIADSYPHQLSGGQQQRVLIAMALSAEPRLLVLDEPTTGLDVTTEAAVLDLVKELIAGRDTSALYVTHNLGVVAGVTDRVAVLYASELVEDAPTEALFTQPLHPYTRGLIDSIPRLGQRKGAVKLNGIPGRIPRLDDLPQGCVFAPRCPIAIDRCHEERPPLDTPLAGRSVRCFRWPEILSGEVSLDSAQPARQATREKGDEVLLDLQNVQVRYPVQRNPMQVLTGQPRQEVRAVRDLDLTLKRGSTLGVVGESGSGKTSLARAVIGLVERAGGEMSLVGISLQPGVDQRAKAVLKRLQMVFQNPQEALNPYMTVGESLRRPLVNLLNLNRAEADERVARLLESVRLPRDFARRLPGQLSGGEKQRVAIARAFAANPDLLIADEPVSALDVSVQANILNLLNDLQAEHGTTIIFISHDLAVVAYLADQVAVMYLGHLMELSDADGLFTPPYHPYTEALLSVIPVTDPNVEQAHIRLTGEIPSAIDVPSGCPFHTRCPRYLGDTCKHETPPWQQSPDGKRIFCHIPINELIAQQHDVIVLHSEPS